jgi:hypothetical protein
MYRTEKIYNNVKDKELNFAICVPSYDRPNNAFIKWIKSGKTDIPKERLFMFIRNTKEQKQLYKPLREFVNIVLISPDTRDLGDTRQQIVEWAYEKKYDLIFMIDDRINGIWWLSPIERNGKEYFDVDKRSTPYTAFKIWATEHMKKGMVATSITNKGFHWMPDRIGKPIEPLNGSGLSCCIALSPIKMIEAGVNYQAIEDVGVEDVYILYALLTHKLPFCNLVDIAYNQVASGKGGDASVYPNMTRVERLLKVKKLFWEKTLGLEWGQPHPGFKVVQTKNEPDIIRVNYKFWRKLYDNS